MPAAIPIVAGVAGAAISANGAKKAAQTQAQAITEANKQDPRIEAMLYGSNGQNGLLSQYQSLLNAPQSDAMKGFTQQAGSYLGNAGADFNSMRAAAGGLLNPISAPQASAAMWGGTPQMSAASAGPAATMTAAQSQGAPQVTAHGQGDVLWNKGESFSAPNPMQAAQASAAQVNLPPGMQAAMASGAQVNAPAQNNMDLSGSYSRFINGTPGANPYLDQSISGAIAQNRLGFQQLQDDATENLMENVMPSIRSNSVLAGQYGGSRQGVAEGNAIGQLGKEMARAGSQFAQNATNAAVGAKANAYESDSNRALSATQGLGAQQYGVAQTNAGLAQQTKQFNAGQQQQTNATNYAGQLSGAMANAGYTQQTGLANQASNNNAAQTNYAGQLQTNQANAGLAQQANLANQAVGNNAAQFGASQSQAASLANAQLGLNNNQFNAGLQQNAGQFNAGQINNNNQFNAGLSQSAGQFNTGLLQQTGLSNLNNQQQTNMANLQSLLSTNGLNSNNAQAGIGALSGLLGTAAGVTQAGDNYDINRAQQVNGLLAPYLTRNPTGQVAPAANTGAAGLGGAMAGFGLANQFMGFGGGKSSQFDGASMGSFGDLFGKGGFGTSGSYF